MTDSTEYIVLSLMSAGINRATAEQILAKHDAITGAAAFRVAAEVAVLAARSAGDDERGQYAAQVAARVGADLRRTADKIQEKATSGGSQPPAGAATHDLHQTILDAVHVFQVDRRQPGGYDQQLAAHVTQAVAPLVPYRGHALDFFQPGHTYRINDERQPAKRWQFLVSHVTPNPDDPATLHAFGFIRGGNTGGWHPHSETQTSWPDWTDITDTTQGDSK